MLKPNSVSSIYHLSGSKWSRSMHLRSVFTQCDICFRIFKYINVYFVYTIHVPLCVCECFCMRLFQHSQHHNICTEWDIDDAVYVVVDCLKSVPIKKDRSVSRKEMKKKTTFSCCFHEQNCESAKPSHNLCRSIFI